MRSAYVISRPVDNSYLVRDRDRQLLKDVLKGVAAVAALGGCLLLYTWIHIETVFTGYSITELEKELHSLREEERRLRLEATYVAHPRRVRDRAEEHLGLAPADLGQILFYEQLVAGPAVKPTPGAAP